MLETTKTLVFSREMTIWCQGNKGKNSTGRASEDTAALLRLLGAAEPGDGQFLLADLCLDLF
jgi:hypothetical protein